METLSKLFSGEGRVKLMRLFLFNPEELLSLRQICDKAKLSTKLAKTETDILEKAGMIKSRKAVQLVSVRRRGKVVEVKKKMICWQLDENFEYLVPMRNLLINTRPLRKEEIVKRLNHVGKLKLLIVAGVFIQNPDSRVDILIVGDSLKKNTIERIVKTMEAEIGKELVFASFDTADFYYRLGMYDKLIRDILDYPHQKLLNKLNIQDLNSKIN